MTSRKGSGKTKGPGKGCKGQKNPKKRSSGTWKKGQSGNPTGRTSRGIMELRESLARIESEGDPDAIARRMYDMALTGDHHWMRIWLEYSVGKAPQPLEHGSGDSVVTIQLV